MSENIELKHDCEAVAIPSGRRQTLTAGTVVCLVERRESSFTVLTANRAMYRIETSNADALELDRPVSGVKQREGRLSEQLAWETLRTVYDPELPVNVVELGLIYSCTIVRSSQGGNTVTVQMAMTSPGCGMSDVLKSEVEAKLIRLPEVSKAVVEVVFEPAWNPSRMSEAARLKLDLGIVSSQGLVRISRDR